MTQKINGRKHLLILVLVAMIMVFMTACRGGGGGGGSSEGDPFRSMPGNRGPLIELPELSQGEGAVAEEPVEEMMEEEESAVEEAPAPIDSSESFDGDDYTYEENADFGSAGAADPSVGGEAPAAPPAESGRSADEAFADDAVVEESAEFEPEADFEAFDEEEFAVPAEAEGFGGGATESDFADVPDVEFVQPLQAGEIDDNDMFGEYLRYRREFEQSGWDYLTLDVDVSERHEINIETSGGIPVLGATVEVFSGQEFVTELTTSATGTIYFFPRAFPGGRGSQNYEVVISKNQDEVTFNFTSGQSDEYFIELDTRPTQQEVQLDVLFLLDATGSMGDEIDQLKDNILSISAQVEALPADPDVRFGMVTYRDRGDEYVTRNYGFTDNVESFQSALRNVEAAGGGDTPEALNEGLHEAVSDVEWRRGETVKLIFLVSDAPPHLDYVQDYSYAEEMQIAAELGIKIHTIASSGLEGEGPHGEYIYRQLAQYTGGNFIFLTYDNTPRSTDQEPGRDVSVPEQNYSVEDLDALVVRLIVEELEELRIQ